MTFLATGDSLCDGSQTVNPVGNIHMNITVNIMIDHDGYINANGDISIGTLIFFTRDNRARYWLL